MSWLEGCPVGGQAGGRSRGPGEPEARGNAAWMKLVCVLAGAALVFATVPAWAQEEAEPAKDAEATETGAEEAAPAADEAAPVVDEAEPAPTEPEEKPKPKVDPKEEKRRKKEEAKRKAKEEARRRDQAKRDKKAAERKKKEEREAQTKADRDAKRKAKTMAKKRREEEERKKKEAAKAAKERVAKGEKGEDLTARLRKSQEQLEREASIKRAGVRLPPDMPLTYVWSLPLKKQVTGERILVRRDVILMVVDWTVLYCIRKSDGVPVWAIDLGGEPQFEPAVTERMVYVFVKNRLIGIDRGRGEIAWRISPSFAASAGPCVAEPTLYIPAWDKRLYAVEVRSHERVFYAGVRTEETLKTTEYDFRPVWHKTAKGHIMGTPVLTDGLLYFGAEDGYLYSVSVDGEARYRSQTQGA
ncbi:MAG: outer membrane protein assembly factor BamB family protein, partial [Planctomycetota bacterium]